MRGGSRAAGRAAPAARRAIMMLVVFMTAASLVMAAALAQEPGARAEEGEAGVSLEVKDAPILGIVRVLAEAGGLQVVFDPGIDCRLTMKVHEARWHPLLQTALSACGLGGEEEGDVLRVAPLAHLREEAAARRRLEAERGVTPSGRLTLVRLSYARAEEMAPRLERVLAPGGRVSYDSRTNTLIIVY